MPTFTVTHLKDLTHMSYSLESINRARSGVPKATSPERGPRTRHGGADRGFLVTYLKVLTHENPPLNEQLGASCT